jgi:Bacterial protein of unknown function (HtrL_YibB)
MSLTYVTAFLNIYKEPIQGKTVADRLNYALPLLNSKIPIIVYISPCYLDQVRTLCQGRAQIEFHVCELTDTETYRTLEPFRDKIPVHRNHEKDTFEFLVLMNAKSEFVSQVAERNPFQTHQFAWIDFSIFHVLKNPLISQRRLEQLCLSELTCSLVVPGCWDKQGSVSADAIHWRFCGGFYMGTQAAVRQFYELHKTYLLKAFGKCSWEVNYWAHIEQVEPTFLFSWYKADHNDSILEVPESLSVLWLTKRATKTGTYPYPPLVGYEPTSSSFLEVGDQQFLNVRYVNYRLTPDGMYIIYDSRGQLKTQNVLLRLTGYETMSSGTPLSVVTDLPILNETIQGLEDIRLYSERGEVQFIATQQQFCEGGTNRMVLGTLDVSGSSLSALRVIEPPRPTRCEKNWIPVGQGRFIYQWYPFQIGVVQGDRLAIVQTTAMPAIFEKVRGSTIFHEVEEGLLGTVHWSEERRPRNYYHMLVLLDRVTFHPIRRSDPFVFGRIGIEFCIGMAVRGPDLQFWYSQHDRDPVWLVVPRAELPMRPI